MTDKLSVTQADRCEHGVRHPHHCDECLDRDIPSGKRIQNHPCYGLFASAPTELSHRASYSGEPFCERCGTEIEGPNNRQKDGAPLCWLPRHRTASEQSRVGLEDIAKFVENWNGETRDGDTVLIAEEIRETFGRASQPTPSEGLATQCSGDTQELAGRMRYFIECIAHADREGWNDATIDEAKAILTSLSSTAPAMSEVEAQRDFIDYHRLQLLNYLLPTANKLKNWSTINYHIQKLHEGGATAITAALSLPSDKTVERELREALEAEAENWSPDARELILRAITNALAELDAHLGEQV